MQAFANTRCAFYSMINEMKSDNARFYENNESELCGDVHAMVDALALRPADRS